MCLKKITAIVFLTLLFSSANIGSATNFSCAFDRYSNNTPTNQDCDQTEKFQNLDKQVVFRNKMLRSNAELIVLFDSMVKLEKHWEKVGDPISVKLDKLIKQCLEFRSKLQKQESDFEEVF